MRSRLLVVLDEVQWTATLIPAHAGIQSLRNMPEIVSGF
jgi:hypothetical protein